MDPQIEELKALIRQNTELVQETNAIVKSLRRSGRISTVMRFLWVGLIVAFSIVSYVYFAPYLEQIQALYGQIQDAIQEARNIGSQFQNPTGR